MAAEFPNRLVSLDIFRGITIGGMIVVNNLQVWSETPRFPLLVHAEWNGCTLADLIFPLFIFIVGVTTVFSLHKHLEAGERLSRLYRHVVIRSAVLFFLGLVVGSWFIVGWLFQAICPPAVTHQSVWVTFFSPPPGQPGFFSLADLRIMGILQRIALVYLAVSLLVINTRWRQQAAVAAALLLLYWGLMSLPGFELKPGKDLGAFIDRAVLKEAHLWQTWDPESLLGNLPAIATGLIGALTGHWLLSGRDGRSKLLGLLAGGCLGILTGSVWGLIFPFNKFLWTSSYAVYTAGWALLFLGFWYGVVDLYQVNSEWVKPCIWLGVNPLLAYCGSQIVFIALHVLYVGTPPHHTHLLPIILNALFGQSWDVLGQSRWTDPQWPALLWALLMLLFWILVTGLLYRKRILIKI